MEGYSEYKDSGVKWLGEIPSHWEVVRFGKHFKFRKGLSITKADLIETGIAVISYGQIHAKNNLGTTLSASLVRYVSQDYLQTHPQCLLTKNDFVFADTSEDIEGSGNFVYNDFKDTIFAGYHTIIAKQNGLYNPKYYAYLFLSESWKNNVRNLVNGVKVYSIGRKQLKDNFLLFPLSHEQDAIVRYLDTATSEIDKAIAMQQKMIDLLNERKQIIIQNAVTKGLDENVEMKESGVEFVNEIPHNWSTRRLKFSAWIRARLGWKGLKASEYVENGYPFLSAFNIENDHMKWNNLNFINKYRYDESPEIKLKVGDLLLVKDGAGIGKCARIDELPYGESTANGSLAVITSYDMLDYRYLYYFMVSKSFKDHTELLINGMGVPHFTQGEMKKIVMPVPPQAEQQQIVTYLDSEMQRFDSAITNCQRQITLLQERKQIIINEVVTGKVRVS